MNLLLRRSTRTASSEEILIFDSDSRDANGAAVNIGKIDVHYLEDQVVGTLLLWNEFITGFDQSHQGEDDESLDIVIHQIMTEITDTLGVPSEYGIEVYYPSVQNYQFVSSYADDEADEEDDDEGKPGDAYSLSNAGGLDTEYLPDEDEEPDANADDFARRLGERS
ncbi:MAG: hypothetical protein QOH93_1155 [Chloroflexia bacterium]|jgi:hypothetical protein|nr:hypothetical protein [Chloroflexia bacterium]